jgi:hypothetical protein
MCSRIKSSRWLRGLIHQVGADLSVCAGKLSTLCPVASRRRLVHAIWPVWRRGPLVRAQGDAITIWLTSSRHKKCTAASFPHKAAMAFARRRVRILAVAGDCSRCFNKGLQKTSQARLRNRIPKCSMDVLSLCSLQKPCTSSPDTPRPRGKRHGELVFRNTQHQAQAVPASARQRSVEYSTAGKVMADKTAIGT